MVEEKQDKPEEQYPSPEDLQGMQFIQYISILALSGMQQLGKMANPLDGKVEKNLAAAQATIELLAILKEKTKGNLTPEEEEVLAGALANLQLNYADEVNKMEKQKDGGP